MVSHLFQNSRSYTIIQDGNKGFKIASVDSRSDNSFKIQAVAIVQVPILYVQDVHIHSRSSSKIIFKEVQCYFHSRLNLSMQVYPMLHLFTTFS